MNYTDEQLLNRVKSLPSFKGIPKGPWLVAVRSKADLFNQFDDYIFLYEGEKFILYSSCTTNPGGPALQGGWKKYTKDGAAIIKSDECYYDSFQASGTKDSNGNTVRKHMGKMHCLRQIKSLLYYRDKNNDKKADETGKVWTGNYSTNIHFNSYSVFQKVKLSVQKWVGWWSAGCVVLNKQEPYEKMYNICKQYGKPVTLVMLKEF